MNIRQDGKQIVDLSQPLDAHTPVYPGDPSVEIRVIETAAEPLADQPRSVNIRQLVLGTHNGTHLDAPFHFFNDQPTIDQLHLERCCGLAACLDVSKAAKTGEIDADDLPLRSEVPLQIKCLLLSTGWCHRWHESDYFTDHPVLTEAAAERIVDLNLDLVGVDFPSVDRAPYATHLKLLGNQVLIVENLTRLDNLVEKDFEFFAVPLPIHRGDASPVRAFAILQ